MNGAVISIPSINEHRDAIVSVLETIRSHKLNHAELHFDESFEQSHDFILLTTQLRRDGIVFFAAFRRLLPPCGRDHDFTVSSADYPRPKWRDSDGGSCSIARPRLLLP